MANVRAGFVERARWGSAGAWASGSQVAVLRPSLRGFARLVCLGARRSPCCFHRFVIQNAVAFASALDDEKREEIYRDGSPEQQHTIGTWLRLGIGQSPDPKAAGRWFRRGAEQGFTSAQFNLGAMYAKGEGVARNYVKAHMWFTITSAYGNKKGKKVRDIVEKRMSATDISRARKLAREWMTKHRK